MKVYESKIIPFKGYLAINLFGYVFTRDIVKFMSKKSYFIHEQIHTEQYKELWYIGYIFVYIWYYLRGLLKYGHHHRAYRANPLEQEAYAQEDKPWYIGQREKFAWKRYK